MKKLDRKINASDIESGFRLAHSVFGQVGGSMSEHVTEVQLLKFAGDASTLSSTEFHTLEAHFSVCGHCLAWLEKTVAMLEQADATVRKPFDEFLKKVDEFLAKVLWESRLKVRNADLGPKMLESDGAKYSCWLEFRSNGNELELTFESTDPRLSGETFSFNVGGKTYLGKFSPAFMGAPRIALVIGKDQINLDAVKAVLGLRDA